MITLDNLTACKIAKKEIKEKLDKLNVLKKEVKSRIEPILTDINLVYKKLNDVFTSFMDVEKQEKEIFIKDRFDRLKSEFSKYTKDNNIQFELLMKNEMMKKWCNKTETYDACLQNLKLLIDEIEKNLPTLSAYEKIYYESKNYELSLLLLEKNKQENIKKLNEKTQDIKPQPTIKFSNKITLVIEYNDDAKEVLQNNVTKTLRNLMDQNLINFNLFR